MSILVTGCAGFIGANFVLDWLAQRDEPFISLDKLIFAGSCRARPCRQNALLNDK